MTEQAYRRETQPIGDVPDDDVEEAAADARESRALAGGGTAMPAAASDILDVEDPAARPAEQGQTGITIRVFGEGEDVREGHLDELERLLNTENRFVWIDISDYQAGDLRRVAAVLGLNRVAVHVALSPWQRPRLDSFHDHYFVATTVARVDPREYRIQAGQLDLFVGHNFLVSSHKLPLPFSQNILQRSRHNPELVHLDSSYVLYIILDELLAYYEDLVEHMQSEIEDAEEHALSDPTDAFLQHLLRLKRYAFALNQLVQHHRQIFEAFLRPDFTFVAGNEISMYFRDLDSRLERLLDTLRTIRESVNGAFDIYVSHMAHRTNNIMRVLTIVSTVILPVTLVVSFFGTSFKGVPIYNPAGFAVMLVLMFAIAGLVLSIFWARRWI